MSGASLDDLGLLPSGQVLANKRMQLTGRPGTHLAVSAPPHISSKGLGQGARPSRPAADRGRWAYSARLQSSGSTRGHSVIQVIVPSRHLEATPQLLSAPDSPRPY